MTEHTLRDRVALVTGSSRGIGASIAELFAAHGALVVVHGRDAQAAGDVRARIEAAGGRAMVAIADLLSLSEVESMRQQIENELGPIDILVANAGGSPVPPKPVEELTEQQWRASVDTNLTTTFFCIKAFLPGMKQRRQGVIITMSSAAARRPDPRSPIAYAASKAAIELLTQDVAAQAGPFGVRVNCVAPESILTERNQQQIPEEVQAAMVDAHPIRRLGTPTDVAYTTLFLASERASWISGVVLDIAGGAVLV